ncbi:AraC family transcriptional regulator [Pseudoalteromonas luteoviolacea]|uniref:helix-turn-helix domain-containing protein n=1 Tax=Pseudoalteromonas luteoviolacea TaxID=43657 RepID=UPI001F1BB9A0|nr:AraC family transcriptional regulator [Pseudoalteromonas luteoviolacea]MCF6439719.1 AraC family transcriptional regulator [Pseudoalteromonas luteoviolacea]
MQENNTSVAGVLHHKAGNKNYDLRRYFPQVQLEGLIEQFWFVDWQLSGDKPHIQNNLPDPNFHLVVEAHQVKLIGPVSKLYTYTMKDKGRILGVKFNIGALSHLLDKPLSQYVDKEFFAREIFSDQVESRLLPLLDVESDKDIFNTLSAFLLNYTADSCVTQRQALALCTLIKNDTNIFSVEALSLKTNLSKRAIQRVFNKHVGLKPKWLIRKYRLHQVLKQLEIGSIDILGVVELLGYTDQAHLIRDFKEIIGITPGQYLK